MQEKQSASSQMQKVFYVKKTLYLNIIVKLFQVMISKFFNLLQNLRFKTIEYQLISLPTHSLKSVSSLSQIPYSNQTCSSNLETLQIHPPFH